MRSYWVFMLVFAALNVVDLAALTPGPDPQNMGIDISADFKAAESVSNQTNPAPAVGTQPEPTSGFQEPKSPLRYPWGYGENQCELIARDYQRAFGGYLMFIQPLKPNGAYDLGDYSGHYINKGWDKTLGNYYIDWQSQTLMYTEGEVLGWYKNMTGREAEIYNLNEGQSPPFPMIYHYW